MERPPVGEVEDLTTLAKLDEQILLGELRERYRKGKIYTYVGDILIAVNPFKDLGIYGKDVSSQYRMSKKSTKPPHIFAIADQAYQSLLGSGGRLPSNQCILISGESGAGKTESTKLIIKQLISLCHGSAGNPNVNVQLEQQILQVNPLLEAFGNAQTNMNDNSSRFGKYIQLKFQKGHVMGAKISEYLLEKSRVVRQGSGEENFHIFYYLFASLPDSHDMFSLRDVDKYRYFSNGMKVLNQNKASLTNRYDELCNSMDLVGFTDEEQLNMFTMIASVLHLGNISFDSDDQDAAAVSNPNGAVRVASKLLQVDQEEVQACLTSMVTVTKGEYVKRNYNKQQAEDARDAMAKAIYGRLFGWIVNKINCLLAPENDIPSDELTEIGILDIFGFEHFEKNSFEQACINLANEQLQFFFNEHIFKMEQEEYMKEGIDWKEIKFVDNKPLLDMFLTRPMGLLALLDEESRFPRGTDQSYVEKVTAHFKGQQYFVASQNTRQAVFSVNHYAGKVTYDCSQWLEKNRDTLPSGVMEILMSSNNPLVKTIFKAQITRTGSLALQGRTLRKSSRIRKMTPEAIRASAAKRKLTVGAQFKTSLNILMERMQSATPVFVRCLKPNHLKKADLFMDEFILAQLLYTGMLETTKIRREGFAVRPLFQEFVDNYQIIVCEHSLRGSAENSAKILRASGITGWHIGKTKVFLKYYHIEQLADIMERIGRSAIILQKAARGFVARRRAARLRQEAEKQRQLVAGLLQHLAQLSLVSFDNNERAHAEDTKKPKDKKKGQNGHVELPPVPPVSPGGNVTSVLPPQSHSVSCGTGMDDDDEIIDDDFKAEASNKKKFGTPGRQATTVWFQETQTENVIDTRSNKFADWFHGIISRRQSEVLLRGMPVGCYLIRVSESRFGYTLSFRAEDRSRHYMIDQLKNGKFIIIGEDKVHRSLHDLIEHHKTHRISNWGGLLSDPCGQSGDCDYMDLLDEANRMYFVLDEKDGKSTRKSTTTPSLPPRNYSMQPPPGQARMSGRPLPQVPPGGYQRLIANQAEQHRYHQLEQTPDRPRSRLSATRKRLH